MVQKSMKNVKELIQVSSSRAPLCNSETAKVNPVSFMSFDLVENASKILVGEKSA